MFEWFLVSRRKPASEQSKQDRFSSLKEHPLILTLGSMVAIIIAIATVFYDIQGRLGRLEGRIEILSGLVEKKVVTETVVVTSTATVTTMPAIPGFPFESIIAGLLLGTILVLAFRCLQSRKPKLSEKRGSVDRTGFGCQVA